MGLLTGANGSRPNSMSQPRNTRQRNGASVDSWDYDEVTEVSNGKENTSQVSKPTTASSEKLAMADLPLNHVTMEALDEDEFDPDMEDKLPTARVTSNQFTNSGLRAIEGPSNNLEEVLKESLFRTTPRPENLNMFGESRRGSLDSPNKSIPEIPTIEHEPNIGSPDNPNVRFSSRRSDQESVGNLYPSLHSIEDGSKPSYLPTGGDQSDTDLDTSEYPGPSHMTSEVAASITVPAIAYPSRDGGGVQMVHVSEPPLEDDELREPMPTTLGRLPNRSSASIQSPGPNRSPGTEEDEDDDDDVHAPPVDGGYEPSDYEHLNVSGEIKELFSYISRCTPQAIELDHHLKPFIPDYIPAVGDIDAFIKIARPDGQLSKLGLTILDEPSAKQSDPTVLDLQLRAVAKHTTGKAMAVKTIESAEKNPKVIEKWVKDISDLYRSKPPPTVQYPKRMPDIDTLMQEWPGEVEDLLRDVNLPTAALTNLDLQTYIDIICAMLDIPVYKSRIHSLHVLFTLYSVFKNSGHFRLGDEDLEQENLGVDRLFIQ